MNVNVEKICNYRLHAHHLDRKMPVDGIITAAGVCGLQNTPPGTWEKSLFNRLDGCTMQALNDALYSKKTLPQA